MRQGGPNNKRGRGRNGPQGNNGGGMHNGGGNRRPMMPNRNQNFDSNGPDVRIRGSAYQVHEKYMNLAQDATAAGDRIMAESYYQHAEHYYRIINAQEYGPDGQRRREDGQNSQQGGYQYQQNNQDESQPGSDETNEGEDRPEPQQGHQPDQPQRQGISHESYTPPEEQDQPV
jgi:hypothetical protein